MEHLDSQNKKILKIIIKYYRKNSPLYLDKLIELTNIPKYELIQNTGLLIKNDYIVCSNDQCFCKSQYKIDRILSILF